MRRKKEAIPQPGLLELVRAWAGCQKLSDPVDSMELVRAAEHVCQLEGGRFLRWPGSVKGGHHEGEGGLARHTEEVMRLCWDTLAQPAAKDFCAMTVMMAALWHDVGKIDDYEVDPVAPLTTAGHEYRYSRVHSLEGHVAASYRRWLEYLSARAPLGVGAPLRRVDVGVGHCILSHHGRREWGSPVEPTTPLAWIVHLADMTSAKALGRSSWQWRKD